jgi:hypothetical protein
MTLAAFLPRTAERADMRYQWIARFIDNHRVDCDAVMEPFARAVLATAAASGRVVLIMDQTKASERHQVLMLAVRFGERALPLACRGDRGRDWLHRAEDTARCRHTLVAIGRRGLPHG